MTFDLYLAAFVARPGSDLRKVYGEALSFAQKVCTDVGHEWAGPSCSRCLLRHSEFTARQQLLPPHMVPR